MNKLLTFANVNMMANVSIYCALS